MNAFEQMNWPVWKNLTDSEKQLLMRQVLMYFVSPLKLVKDVQLKDFAVYGIKSRTFELTIDGEPFVFVPGQKDAILGWDKGTESVNTRELISGDLAFYYYENKKQPVFPDPEDLKDYANEHTSPLRKAAVPPMLVSKFPVPFGMTFEGALNTTTGNFKGNIAKFNEVKSRILPILFPQLTPEASLSYEFPLMVIDDDFYCFLDEETNNYYLYRPVSDDVAKIKKELRRYNYDFPTEDEFEFMNTAGSRRLFFYSNQNGFFSEDYFKSNRPIVNMFGIHVFRLEGYFYCEENIFKRGPIDNDKSNVLESLLPLSYYYREVMTSKDLEYHKDLFYQKIIRIKP